jgi:outer membrane lipoprotein LolB
VICVLPHPNGTARYGTFDVTAHATRSLAAILTLLALLSGCAGQSPREVAQGNWQDRSAQLQQLDHWKAEGKMAVRNARSSESVSITWTQNKDKTRLDLSGPMGLQATTILSDGKVLEVNRAGNSTIYDISSPDEFAREIGWVLPLTELHHWLKGIPVPGTPFEALDVEEGLLKRLQQSGWTVTFESFRQYGPYALPTRLQIERTDTRARLIIRNWTIEEA